MTKRLVLLAGILAVLLTAAVPALAQQGQVTATGVLVGPVEDNDLDPTPEYELADEASGITYVLISGFVELEPYAGERVTITGVPIGGADNAPPALNVTQIEPADGPPPGPSPDRSATLSFELTVEGEPPAGATFFGVVPAEGCISEPLTDSDGDGTYTGSVEVPRFAPGPVLPDTEPVSLPVQIVQAGGGTSPCDPSELIEDFGVVPIEGDETFSASVSFDGEGTTPGPSPDRSATLSFELTVKGEPPADATFFGFIPAEGSISAPLTDSDGDGVYTGSVDVPKFPPGPAPPGTEPVSLPVQIVQAGPQGLASEALGKIRDFGLVKIDGDKTFSAKVNFNRGGGDTTAPDTTTPGSGGSDDGGSGSGDGSGGGEGSDGPGNGGSGSGGEGSGGSGNSSGSDGGGSGGGSGSGESSGGTGGITGLLPSTGGGMALTVLVAGVLLVAGGLLVRRIFR